MKKLLIMLLFFPLVLLGQTEKMDSLVKSKINYDAENPVFNILLHIEKEDGISFSKGYGVLCKESVAATKDSQFKIASSTKLFVSVIILQLIEEGKLRLSNTASAFLHNVSYINKNDFLIYEGKNYFNEITIEQLLMHRTGLADIFTDRQNEFFEILMTDPQKQYSPEKIIKLYYQLGLNQSSHFKPNAGWYYSDMNYLLLGLIIESIDHQNLSNAIRKRILTPLEMENTYFEYYEKPKGNNNQICQFIGNINMSEINTSFDWGGGGLLSTNQDLSIFIKGIFEMKLINSESLEKMIDVRSTISGENRYGLGIYESEFNNKIFYGHYGFYGTYVGYCREDKSVLSYSIGQATPDFSVYNLINEVLKNTE